MIKIALNLTHCLDKHTTKKVEELKCTLRLSFSTFPITLLSSARPSFLPSPSISMFLCSIWLGNECYPPLATPIEGLLTLCSSQAHPPNGPTTVPLATRANQKPLFTKR